MSKDELTSLSLCEMAAAIRSGDASPEQLVVAHLDRIEQLNPTLNAFVFRNHRSLENARTATELLCRGLKVGPLHGVPITIKCSVDVMGWPCPVGSRLRSGYVAQSDAPLVSRLRRAGAILLGNTNTPEFLMAYETDNLICGRTNSPWQLERTPGGSSGGEAAAIAACCSAGGVGSDGGGSIRIPAHFTGICGLKPTNGRVPATGHFPASTGHFSIIGVVGPMARTFDDIKLLFEIMAGLDYSDPSSSPVPFRNPNETEVARLRIGFFEHDGLTPVTCETCAAVRKAATILENSGMAVEEFLPAGLSEALKLWWDFFGRAGEHVLQPLVADRESDLSPILKAFLDRARNGPPLTLDGLLQSMLGRDELRSNFLREMEKYRILLCPVCAVPAFRHGEREWTIEDRAVDYWQAMSYSQWFNLLGNPAAVVPVGKSPEGLPIGVQVVGRPFEDELVLAVAKKIQEGCGDEFKPPL